MLVGIVLLVFGCPQRSQVANGSVAYGYRGAISGDLDDEDRSLVRLRLSES